MADRRDPTPEQRAETIALAAADRAASLALAGAEKAQAIAVAQAVRDANVDRDLREHDAHLREINGSQRAMAASLENMEKTLGVAVKQFETQAAVTAALAANLSARTGAALSRRSLWIAALGALAAWGSVLAAVALAGG